ncbi:very-long-chain enoyl-CoA reductase [Aureococcus anophagefferens]|nr:very-long-chain enoyl-CoA reductase [Aureococcus anophagefferens]
MAASKNLAPPAAPRHFFGVDMNGDDVLAPVASVSSLCGTLWTMRAAAPPRGASRVRPSSLRRYKLYTELDAAWQLSGNVSSHWSDVQGFALYVAVSVPAGFVCGLSGAGNQPRAPRSWRLASLAAAGGGAAYGAQDVALPFAVVGLASWGAAVAALAALAARDPEEATAYERARGAQRVAHVKALVARLAGALRGAVAGRAAPKVAPESDAGWAGAAEAGLEELKRKLLRSRPPALVVAVYLTAFVAVILTVYFIHTGVVPSSYWGTVDDVKEVKHEIHDQKRQLETYRALLSAALDAINATSTALGVAGNETLASRVAAERTRSSRPTRRPGDVRRRRRRERVRGGRGVRAVVRPRRARPRALPARRGASTNSGLVSYGTLDAIDDDIAACDDIWKACDGLVADMNELGWAAEYAWVVGCWFAFCWTFPCIFYVLRQWDEGLDALQSGDAARSAKYARSSISAAPSLLGNVISAWAWVWLILALLGFVVAVNLTYPPLLNYWLTWQWWLYSIVITTTIKSAIVTPYLYKKRATDGAVVLDRGLYTLCFAGWLVYGVITGTWGAFMRLCYFIIWSLQAVFLFDSSLLPEELRSLDSGYGAFCGMLWAHHRHSNPHVLVACRALRDTSDDPPARRRARNRFGLALTLLRNPGLAKHRRPGGRPRPPADDDAAAAPAAEEPAPRDGAAELPPLRLSPRDAGSVAT